jgi:acetyltransferase-like isoleucine patch superfamily enzyme
MNNTIDSPDATVDMSAKLNNVIIQARKVLIKKGAVLYDCKLFAPDGEVIIGEGVTIKERAILSAFKGIRIGNKTIIDRDVYVGGMQSEKSMLEIGSDCVVLYRSFLNTTRRVMIGDNVGIGGYCKIFTHGAWPNALTGGPFSFADVEIQDGAWMAWGVMVVPGVTIMKRSIIGAGSVVTKDVPSRAIVAGAPAKIIGRHKALQPRQKEKVMREVLEDFCGYAAGFLKAKNRLKQNKDGSIAIEFEEEGSTLYYAPSLDSTQPTTGSIVMSYKISASIKKQHSEWIELDTLRCKVKSKAATDFVSFVKRYGIGLKSTGI